jgi:N-acetyl-gamma-glutamyl-phosphate reductase
VSTHKAHETLQTRYENEPFVRVHPIGELPQIKHVVGSNFCDIGVVVDERVNRLIVVSAEDNLVKGAAGQAVQNMNIMCGFSETSGLMFAPAFP